MKQQATEILNEAMCYVDNANQILTEKAGKDDGFIWIKSM
jgi:hypothetical protein